MLKMNYLSIFFNCFIHYLHERMSLNLCIFIYSNGVTED